MTPMTEIEKLKDGVYEKVMSRRFAEVLKEALAEDQVRAEEEDVDAEEAVGYLSSYLQQVIRLCLKDIADRDEENSVAHQLALTNELIASLAKKTEELGGGQEVANAPFLLRSANCSTSSMIASISFHKRQSFPIPAPSKSTIATRATSSSQPSASPSPPAFAKA